MEADAHGQLCAVLGVPIEGELLLLALTHRSYAHEHPGVSHNERLEFLGDAVLGQAVTVRLYREFPALSEGDLAKRRASIVSTVALAAIARSIGLGHYLRLGRGETGSGGHDKDSILADTVEAIIGATYLSGGAAVAEALVHRLVDERFASLDDVAWLADPKSALHERATRFGAPPPQYDLTESGPDHARRFEATVRVGALVVTGTGTSKKQSESAAARAALGMLAAPDSGTPDNAVPPHTLPE